MRALWAAVAAVLGAPTAAWAAPLDDVGGRDDELWKALENMPPEWSSEIGVQASFSDITYWNIYQGPYPGFGFRWGIGRHVGEDRANRFGGSLGLMIEGPVPSYWSATLEPMFAWDRVSHRFQVGASIGPGVALHGRQELLGTERTPGFSPMAAVRLGWSQPWSRALHRMYVVGEPRVRLVDGRANPGIVLLVGSGSGW